MRYDQIPTILLAILGHLCPSPRTHLIAFLQISSPSSSRDPELSLQMISDNTGVLHLVAAWDQLASRLPPAAGTGPAAELLLAALKLALAHAGEGSRNRLLIRASRLAEIAAECPLLDAEAIAAGIVAAAGHIPLSLVENRLGPITAQLFADMLKVAALPARVDLLDDHAASALRELAFSFYDVRAVTLEIIARMDDLTSSLDERGGSSVGSGDEVAPELQGVALEALQVYAPMAHALGLGKVGAQLEDCCFKVLFPESYARTEAWLEEKSAVNAEMLAACQKALEEALRADPSLMAIVDTIEVRGRTKSLFSTLKKMLRLGNTHKGGRTRTQLFDLMGLRAIVVPKDDLPLEVAETSAARACYSVREVARSLWQPAEGRSKDYIAHPKSNGYQSLHETFWVRIDSNRDIQVALELQVRTLAMHEAAEMGEAAHGAYKGGLDAFQARQLRSWTEALMQKTAQHYAVYDSALDSSASLFCHLDQNGDGRVSLAELESVLHDLGWSTRSNVAAARELLRSADTDGDGFISMEEFVAFQKRVGLVHAARAFDTTTAFAIDVDVATSEGELVDDGTSDGDRMLLKSWNSQKKGPGNITNKANSKYLHTWQNTSKSDNKHVSTKSLTRSNNNPNTRTFDAVILTSVDEHDFILEEQAVPELIAGDDSDMEALTHSRHHAESLLTSGKGDRKSKRGNANNKAGWEGVLGRLWYTEMPRYGAVWRLIPLPSNRYELLDPTGQPRPMTSVTVPYHGPCIIGGALDTDADIVIDCPLISRRHAYLQIVRSKTQDTSRCILMDLHSTNGTFVNRKKLQAFKEVDLSPGDIVYFAEAGIAYQVQALPKAFRNVPSDSDEDSPVEESCPLMDEALTTASRVVAASEQALASKGLFAPPAAIAGASPSEIAERARELVVRNSDFEAAYALLLAAVMEHTRDGGLWAQLASMERRRALRSIFGSSYAAARIFYRAASYCKDTLLATDATSAALRSEGRARVYLSWAQFEWDMKNEFAARILFQKAIKAGRWHPDGPVAGNVLKALFAWATRESKRGGDAAMARRLCSEALDLQPDNAYVLTLLGNMDVHVGKFEDARQMFQRALHVDRKHASAWQSWARLEANAGDIEAARKLFKKALVVEPENRYILQAWAVAELRGSNVEKARSLLHQCLELDAECRAALHALGQLELNHGSLKQARALFMQLLDLEPKTKNQQLEACSALAGLESKAKNFQKAEIWCDRALGLDKNHVLTLKTLAWIKKSQNKVNEAEELYWKIDKIKSRLRRK